MCNFRKAKKNSTNVDEHCRALRYRDNVQKDLSSVTHTAMAFAGSTVKLSTRDEKMSFKEVDRLMNSRKEEVVLSHALL